MPVYVTRGVFTIYGEAKDRKEAKEKAIKRIKEDKLEEGDEINIFSEELK